VGSASAQWRSDEAPVPLFNSMIHDTLNRADTSVTRWYSPQLQTIRRLHVILISTAADSVFVFQFMRYSRMGTTIGAKDSAQLLVVPKENGFYPLWNTADSSGLVHVKLNLTSGLFRADFYIEGPIIFPIQLRGSISAPEYKTAKFWYYYIIPETY
jgi:hypothetical protein